MDFSRQSRPTHTRRPAAPKHAFEEALDAAEASPDDDLSEFIGASLSNPMCGPAVGSIGDMAVASGYVGTASLAKVYEPDDDEPDEAAAPADPPGEAARKLIASLAEQRPTPEELKRLRRRFAAAYHPDRVAPDRRDDAVSAMADVNAAIDLALKEAVKGGAT